MSAFSVGNKPFMHLCLISVKEIIKTTITASSGIRTLMMPPAVKQDIHSSMAQMVNWLESLRCIENGSTQAIHCMKAKVKNYIVFHHILTWD